MSSAVQRYVEPALNVTNPVGVTDPEATEAL